MNWKDRLKSALLPAPARRGGPQVAPGMHHFMMERDGQFVRFHLRVEVGGHGLLIASASEAVRLSPLGAAAAWALLSQQPSPDIPDQALQSVQRLLDELGGPSARYPILDALEPRVGDGKSTPMPPLRADVDAAEEAELRRVIDRLWEATVPHIRLRRQQQIGARQLVEAVEHAEDIGMIAGLRASATALADTQALDRLADAGLDYVVTPWVISHELHAAVYAGGDFDKLEAVVEHIRRREMTPVLEAPLTPQTEDLLEDRFDWLTSAGVENVEVFAVVSKSESPNKSEAALHAFAPRELRQLAAWIEDLADESALRWIWLPPVAIAGAGDVIESCRRGPRAGGAGTIRVQADGEVFAPHGGSKPAGNLLTGDAETIWKSISAPTGADPSDPACWATE